MSSISLAQVKSPISQFQATSNWPTRLRCKHRQRPCSPPASHPATPLRQRHWHHAMMRLKGWQIANGAVALKDEHGGENINDCEYIMIMYILYISVYICIYTIYICICICEFSFKTSRSHLNGMCPTNRSSYARKPVIQAPSAPWVMTAAQPPSVATKCFMPHGTTKPRKETRIPTTSLPFFTQVASIMWAKGQFGLPVLRIRSNLILYFFDHSSHTTCEYAIKVFADKKLCQIWEIQKTRLLASIVAN